MYRKIRNIHLLLGVSTLPFLIMYGVSAMQMAHPKWFSQTGEKTSALEPLPRGISDGRAIAGQLFKRGLVEGELQRTNPAPDHIELRIVRPGTVSVVDYNRATGTTLITTTRSNFMMMLNRLHHVAGIHHQYAPLNAWGWALGLIAALLILLAASGIYLWFRTHKERRIGAFLLGLNLSFSIAMILILRLC